MDDLDDHDDRRYGGETGATWGGGLLDIARNNPVGTALAVAGLSLMLAPRIEREDARRAYRRARGQAREYGALARESAAARGAQLRDTAHEVRDRAEDWGERIEDRAEALRARVEAGTETLGEDARRRVIAARRRALEAQERADAAADKARRGANRAVHEGTSQLRDSYREHPLLAGALVLGVGAAIGAALPRSRIENERLGDISRRLKDEAEALYHRELARVEGAARGALQEGREMAAETAQTVREHVPDGPHAVKEAESNLREGASRVTEGARRGGREAASRS